MLLRAIDFETTGLPPDAAVVEVGFQDLEVVFRDGIAIDWLFNGSGRTFVNPYRPIPPEASAFHHIVDGDVIGASNFEGPFLALTKGADIFVAHNAAFERAFFAGGDTPWICTLKAARRVWPDAPGHSNQVLRYWLNLPLMRERAEPAHRAEPDAYVTAYLLLELLRKASIDDMIKWTGEPSLLPRVNFGKHRGKAWSEVPRDYLEWIIFKSEMDEDVKFTAKHHLEAQS